jgi:hypothetical protein
VAGRGKAYLEPCPEPRRRVVEGYERGQKAALLRHKQSAVGGLMKAQFADGWRLQYGADYISQQLQIPGSVNRLRAAVYVQFAVEALGVCLDGVEGNVEGFGDFPVRQAGVNQSQYLKFPLG